MRARKLRLAVIGLVVFALAFGLVGTAAAGKDAAPGEYIVVVKKGISPSDVGKSHGFAVRHVYSVVLNGFSGTVPEGRLKALQNDPRVKLVEADQEVYAIQQTLTTGVNRIDAENLTNKGTGIKIAVIDTGIDLDHPDLNVAGHVTFVRWTRSGNDDNGHGSWVAGIIAALDNDIGVVGVAPEASLYAVKVLNRYGSGYLSDVINGLDWAATNDMDVASMSLSAKGTSDAFHESVINAVDAGVTIVVAAGNDGADADAYIPATYDEVVTVSAIADSDGDSGGLGPVTSYGADDAFATFSNFGADIDLAAPGVDIYSTYKNAGYATGSGTSASCPHAAGVAALYIRSQLDQGIVPSPADVRAALIAAGTPQGAPNGFTGDPDAYPEPLLNAAAIVGPLPTLQSITVTPETASVPVGLTQQYVATGTYSDGGTKDITTSVTWTSSNTGVATIDVTGLATAKAEGITNITATKEGVDSNVATLTVTAPVLVSIGISPETASIEVGSTQQYAAVGTYSDGATTDITTSVTWASSNTAVATIDATGLATGQDVGTTIITATKHTVVSNEATLQVMPTLVSIAVTPETASVPVGLTQQYVATGTYSDGGTADLTTTVAWASSDTAIATIDASGRATGIAVGTATIMATLESLTDSATLTVTEAPAMPTMTVLSVDVELTSRWRGWIYYAEATVTIVNAADGSPVEGATVSGYWSGATSDTNSSVTDANGQVVLTSDSVWKAASGTTFTFTVTNVTHSDFRWDNVEKSGSAAVP